MSNHRKNENCFPRISLFNHAVSLYGGRNAFEKEKTRKEKGKEKRRIEFSTRYVEKW